MPHIIVVGAGIIGASIAYNLSNNGVEVTILEQNQPASGATSKSFSWINANYPGSRNYFDLRQSSIAEYHRLSADLKANIGLQWGGSLRWDLGDSSYSTYVNSLRSFNYDVNDLNLSEFNALEPGIAATPDRCAHFYSEGAVDAVALTKALVAGSKRSGATLITGCKAQNLLIENGRCVGVDTSSCKMYADTVVVAMGVHSQAFVATAGIDLPMKNREGIIVHTQAVEPVINHLMLSPNLHFRQHIDGSILMAEDFSGESSGSDPRLVANELLKILVKYLPGISGVEFAEITVGKRPVPADGFPVIGQPENLNGLYIATMHSGVTLAPIVGKLAAKEILEGQPQSILSPYRLSRF